MSRKNNAFPISATILLTAFLFCPALLPGTGTIDVVAAERDFSLERIAGDQQTILRYREGLQRTLAFVDEREDLFPAKAVDARLLNQEEKREIVATWQRLMDYMLALDSLAHQYENFVTLKKYRQRAQAFATLYSAYLAQYRHALEFIARVENDRGLDILLNEAIPSLGLAANSYHDFKLRFLNLARGGQYLAMNSYYKLTDVKPTAAVRQAIEEDNQQVIRFGQGMGERLTLENAMAVISKIGTSAWFPIQAGIAEWMGDTKVVRPNKSLISHKQIAHIKSQLQPGDILLTRREWYLSNIGLPGFWPHAAIYLGTEEERADFFNQQEVKAWVQGQGIESGDFNALLRYEYPRRYVASLQHPEKNHSVRVIEAISEGVSFTSLEHAADADSVAVLRPRLSPKEKAVALRRAFSQQGKPYDFNFDFLSDSSLVCTELVYKSYQPAADFRGVTLPIVEVLGRKVTTANDIARMFDEEYDNENRQLDLIAFLDGNEWKQKADEATEQTFRQSWRRPKWHILMPQDEKAKQQEAKLEFKDSSVSTQ